MYKMKLVNNIPLEKAFPFAEQAPQIHKHFSRIGFKALKIKASFLDYLFFNATFSPFVATTLPCYWEYAELNFLKSLQLWALTPAFVEQHFPLMCVVTKDQFTFREPVAARICFEYA